MKRKCHADFRVREISFPTVADRRAARCHAKGEKTIQHKFNKTVGEGVVAVGPRLENPQEKIVGKKTITR